MDKFEVLIQIRRDHSPKNLAVIKKITFFGEGKNACWHEHKKGTAHVVFSQKFAECHFHAP